MDKSFNEIFETLPANGWLTKPEAELLYASALMTDGPILEVGCYYGRSTVLLASLGRPVYCVDPFSNFASEDASGEVIKAGWRRNLKDRGILNATLFHQKIETWNGPKIEFAYLDGDHTFEGTLAQITKARMAGANVVCIHDYADEGEGAEIKRAIEYVGGIVEAKAERMVRVRFL